MRRCNNEVHLSALKEKMNKHKANPQPKNPGAPLPPYCNKLPPSRGATTRVRLPTEADRPKVRPVSCCWTS